MNSGLNTTDGTANLILAIPLANDLPMFERPTRRR
jgi:hypothetical protein